MFVSVSLEVKLVDRIMPKFEFNLKVLNTSVITWCYGARIYAN